MGLLWWTLGLLAALFLLVFVANLYLAFVLKWGDERTVGLRYYGLPPRERDRFKQQLRRQVKLLSPVLWLNARLARFDFRRARIVYKGVSAPSGSCSVDSFAKAASYVPRREDVFITTQMKCGTTWMQQVVYEVLNRGRGDLVESGRTMYAVAPWLEGRKSVSVDEAPAIGSERPSRIIKTHLPVSLCPFSADARYIYVARHPVSCFASCMDFVVTNVGRMAPPLGAFEEWFCSPELMWWGTWTDHVMGWWSRAQSEPNVLFVFFEDMKRDLPAVVRRVEAFLGVQPLTSEELAAVVHKSGFNYMQQHQGTFEMHPPHILQTRAELFVSGSAERHKDVPESVRDRLRAWAARSLSSSDFPLATAYPDVASADLEVVGRGASS